jgi:hypothetical protein
VSDNKTQLVQVRLTEHQLEKLRFVATHNETTKSEVVRAQIDRAYMECIENVAMNDAVSAACMSLELPDVAQGMSIDDIVSMLDEQRRKRCTSRQ